MYVCTQICAHICIITSSLLIDRFFVDNERLATEGARERHGGEVGGGGRRAAAPSPCFEAEGFCGGGGGGVGVV